MAKREHMVSIPMTDDERRMLRALSEVTDRSMSQLVREWVREAFDRRFGSGRNAAE
ncbi:MAG: hypothetical protein U0169_02090 [Polyangiaceae bacterium]